VVAIQHRGRRSTPDGEREFADYRVVAGRTSEAPDWNSLMADDEERFETNETLDEARPPLRTSAFDDIPF
jgi:hypothetical protein